MTGKHNRPKQVKGSFVKWGLVPMAGGVLLTLTIVGTLLGGIDSRTGDFSYSGYGGVDDTLGRIALFLMDNGKLEGSAYVSEEAEEGIVGFQLRYFDDGNELVDEGDWMSVRRYMIPAVPDTNVEKTTPGYWKKEYVELVDKGLDGLGPRDYYFIKGRRFDLSKVPQEVIQHYQVQVEAGVSIYVRNVGFDTITGQTGSAGQTSIRKEVAFEDGSLPSNMVIGLDLGYVFRPIDRPDLQADQKRMAAEMRRNFGLVYAAILTYTDVQGYQLRDLAGETQVIERTFDASEAKILKLVLDTFFDRDGDGIITPDDLVSGYTKFRELHQRLADEVRGKNRRVVLTNEKLAAVREEYERVHGEPYEF